MVRRYMTPCNKGINIRLVLDVKLAITHHTHRAGDGCKKKKVVIQTKHQTCALFRFGALRFKCQRRETGLVLTQKVTIL